MLCVNDNASSLVDIVESVDNFEIYNNGEIKKIPQQADEFLTMKSKLRGLFSCARLMPAFGVSLHNETTQELKKDVWLKINFNKIEEKNGLYFSALLFKLEDVQGFNLIRLYNGKYDGRCLYLDLDEPTDLKSLLL
ncbi:MAG: hypothetical protein IJW36_03575 [Clostridia bacterium]|nr:hypothetical protein [Clostridia bacterium]